MTLVRRPAVPIAIAIGGLAIAAGPALAVPSAEVVVQPRIDPENAFELTIDNASSVANAFSITNTSGDENITKVTFDLSTGDFPNMVFTPNDEAGDVGAPEEAQPFAVAFPPVSPGDPETNITASILAPNFLPVGGVARGGYSTLEISVIEDLGDVDGFFGPGDTAVFRVDVDPNSINGTDAEGSVAGPVSGAELQGATVTVEFNNNPDLTFSSKLSLISDPPTSPSGIGAQAFVNALTDAAPAPGLSRPGGATSSIARSATQTVVVSGVEGQTGTVVVADAHLNTLGAGAVPIPVPVPESAQQPPTPGLLEVNTANEFRVYEFTIGAGGTDEVEVGLSDIPGDPGVITGRNVITAFRTDIASPGKTSEPIVLELEPGAETDPPSVTSTTPGNGATDVAAGDDVTIAFSEEMDKGTLTNPGTITVAPQSGGPAVSASVATNADGTEATVDPNASLAPGTTYEVRTTTNARDLAGNGLPGPDTRTFTTTAAPTSPPPPGPGDGGTSPGGSPAESPAGAPSAGGTVPTAGSPVCNPVPERGTSEKGTIRYTRQALKIQQNIDSAVIRRLNAVNAWIDAGIAERDLCAGAFGPGAFQDGLSFTTGAPHPLTPPDPREIEILKKDKDGNPITKSRRQLTINENISRALKARAEATAERITSLTGGNLAPGVSLSGRAALSGLAVSGPRPPSQDASATALNIGPLPKPIPIRENAATVQKQQRRSQGSIVLANRALDAITGGLTEENFKPGSIGVDRI